MTFDRFLHWWLPPALAWRLDKPRREKRETAAFTAFYQNFLTKGDLCFDIGANLGNRTRCFRKLECEVVAVEPQHSCFQRLKKLHGNDSSVHLVNQAVGRETGEATLHVSPDHVLSSLSTEFIQRTQGSGRFANSSWDGTQRVGLTTLDQLIEQFGMPRFIKIDVEGFESEVLAGLTQAVPALSIEWTPEFPENTRTCLSHLEKLGDYEFNVSWGESMRFSKPSWRSLESMLRLIDEFESETQLFGDIYARLRAS